MILSLLVILHLFVAASHLSCIFNLLWIHFIGVDIGTLPEVEVAGSWTRPLLEE